MQKEIKLKGRTGFTLIELAAVIVAMGLLAAILLPVLGKARRNADTLLCTANLRQVGMMVDAYSCDNNGRMVSNSRYQHRWFHNLWAYSVVDSKYKSPSTRTGEYYVNSFYCPVEYKKYMASTAIKSPTQDSYVGMYGYNLFFMCRVEDNGTFDNPSDDYINAGYSYMWFSKIRLIKEPSTLPIFWDNNSDVDYGGMIGYPHMSTRNFGWDSTGSVRALRSNQSGPSINHFNGFNYLYADMHAGNPGNWPYNISGTGLYSGQNISWARPGTADDYLIYFHPLRKLYISGNHGAKTIGDGYPGKLSVR